MRFFVVSCVFPPEPMVSSQTSSQIAEKLAQRGHKATVVTAFPSRPSGKLYGGYSRKLFQLERWPGDFEVIRCFSLPSARSNMVSRFIENISFGLTAGLVTLVSPKPDLIYANTWPIFATGILALVSRLRHVPMVVSIQDVYPESIISQGRIRDHGYIADWMRWMDGLVARACQAVIVISESFGAIYRLQRGVSSARLHVIPNWVDSESIVHLDKGARSFRSSRNIPQDAFVFLYGGNIGSAAGVETVIESFRNLKEIEDLYLIIAGEGSSLEVCQTMAREIGCPRILFHHPWPKEETSTLLNAANVLILPTRASQSLVSVPSKLISYMLAAKPVIALVSPQSDLNKVIERSGCGWVVEPDQPKMLAAKIREVMALGPAEWERRGKAGREFASANFTKEVCLPRVIAVLEQVVNHG